MPYEVRLTAVPILPVTGGTLMRTHTAWDYRDDYFPRRLHYKRDAEALKQEVERKGGQATVVSVPKRPEPKRPKGG